MATNALSATIGDRHAHRSQHPPAHRLLQAANGGEQITRIRNGATMTRSEHKVDHNGGFRYVHLDAADIRQALRRAGVWPEDAR